MSTQTVTLHTGDSRQVIRTLPENSVDAIVTDPPYELGFMGKAWDRSGIANDVKFWDDCLRVLKPGGHLLAFSGSRTYHRMTCAIEDAGFEVRDQMMWVYGSGFPKSLNVGKALDKEAGAEREIIGSKIGLPGYHDKGHEGGSALGKGISSTTTETRLKAAEVTAPATDLAKQWDGWGTALKPAHEPICVARKPLDGTVAENIRKWGVGGLNIDGCRVDGGKRSPGYKNPGSKRELNGTWNEDNSGFDGIRKNCDESQGRWPANLMHDGSEEVLGLFPGDAKSNAARFFYCPKASKRDRDEGLDGFEERREADQKKDDGPGGDNPRNRTNNLRRNIHPTVKPTELMRYLCRLVTPPGGTVLDPFLGSGSTGKAAVLEGLSFIGIDLSAEYAAIAKARIDHALANR